MLEALSYNAGIGLSFDISVECCIEDLENNAERLEMTPISSSAGRTRNDMELMVMWEFAKRRALRCWESAVGVKWRSHAWTVSSSRRLHPWIRVPIVVVWDALAWFVLLEVGISLLLLSTAWMYFFGMFLLAPYLGVLFWLLSRFVPPVWNRSHPSPYLTTLLAAWSVTFYCILSLIERRTEKKDPGLEVGDFMTAFLLRLPPVYQLVVGYTIFSFGSACAAVMTVDVLLSVYWGFFGTIHILKLCLVLVYHLPWYVVILLGLLFPVMMMTLVRRWRSLRTAGEQLFQQTSFRNSAGKLPV